MMMKYQKPLRIMDSRIGITPTKRYLSDSQVSELLNGSVYVEEKIDGSQCGIAVKGGRIVVYTSNRHLMGVSRTLGLDKRA